MTKCCKRHLPRAVVEAVEDSVVNQAKVRALNRKDGVNHCEVCDNFARYEVLLVNFNS